MYYKITPSIFNAYYYYTHSESLDGQDDENLLTVLRREYAPPTPLMTKGIEFEQQICNLLKTNSHCEDSKINEIVDYLHEGQNKFIGAFQYKTSRMLAPHVEVYGVIDIITPHKIYDLKRAQSYKLGKYEQSIQHLVYMYCTEIPNFEYVIYDGYSFFTEYYKLDQSAIDKLLHKCNEMIDFFISSNKFKAPFIENWSVRIA